MPRITETLISIDCETTGLDVYHGARPFFVTVCHEDGEQDNWEWVVDPLTREVDIPEEDKEQICEVVEKADRIVGQNLKFDAAMLREAGIVEEWPWEKSEDTLIAGHALKSNQAHDLTTMAMVYLHENIAPYEEEMRKLVMKARSKVQQARLKVKRAKSKRAGKLPLGVLDEVYLDPKYGEVLPLLGEDEEIVELASWRIAEAGLPEMPSAKEKTWGYDMWLLQHYEGGKHADLFRDYANVDSAVTLKLWQVFERKLKEQGLWLQYREGMKLPEVISDMELRGVTVSGGRLEEQVVKYRAESVWSGKRCVEIAAGRGYDLQLPKSGNNGLLSRFLFGPQEEVEDAKGFKLVADSGCLNLPVVARSKKTGAPTFDKNVVDYYLSTLDPEGEQYEFVKELSDKRKRDTAVQYMEGYRRFWIPLRPSKGLATPSQAIHPPSAARYEEDGGGLGQWFVLHPSLNQTGTGTLRMSSSNPNEQNISAKEGFNLRYSFGPAPGREYWSLDYRNIELRIPGYKFQEKKMIELFEHPDDAPYFGSYHLLNCSIIWPKEFWAVANIKGEFERLHKPKYKRGKNTGFAIQYGCQEAKADATAGVKGAFTALKDALPNIARGTQEVIEFAKKHGYVETIPDKTIGGRGYPLWCSRSNWGDISPTIPLSYYVQGTAMYCTRKAMVRCKAYLDQVTRETGKLHRITMQVHDEIVFDFPKGGRANLGKVRKLQRLMEESGRDIDIPLKVAVTYHPNNWSEEGKP